MPPGPSYKDFNSGSFHSIGGQFPSYQRPPRSCVSALQGMKLAMRPWHTSVRGPHTYAEFCIYWLWGLPLGLGRGPPARVVFVNLT
jgi:hypothetical protein